MSTKEQDTLKKIKAGRKRQKEAKEAKRLQEGGPWFKKFYKESGPKLGFNIDYYKKNSKRIPFGYNDWETLCNDIEMYYAETMNTFNNVQIPGSIKKPIFYKYSETVEKDDRTEIIATTIRIYNAGTPQTSVIEMAINAAPEVTHKIGEYLQLGSNRKLMYLYSDNKENRKVRTRLAKHPTIDMLKMRILWLFKAGYGISFRD